MLYCGLAFGGHNKTLITQNKNLFNINCVICSLRI